MNNKKEYNNNINNKKINKNKDKKIISANEEYLKIIRIRSTKSKKQTFLLENNPIKLIQAIIKANIKFEDIEIWELGNIGTESGTIKTTNKKIEFNINAIKEIEAYEKAHKEEIV